MIKFYSFTWSLSFSFLFISVHLFLVDPAPAQEIETSPPPMPEEEFYMEPPGMVVEDFVTGLEVVWEITFLPDGRTLITERAGRVRLVSPDGQLQSEPWAAPADVFHSGGGGVMGMALHPGFPEEPWVYIMYTKETSNGPVNRVVRYRDAGDRGEEKEVIMDDIPAANTHNGGRIAFGPDGMLYLTVGDTGQADQSQDPDDLRGSIVRITPEGGIPADNPWPGNPVWAIGLRNVQGLAFHPHSGQLLSADHGPTDHDQIHIIEGGKNYGWPIFVGAADLDEYEDPILEWVPAAPPGGLVFYDGDLIPDMQGDLLFTTLKSEALLRIRFEDADNPVRAASIERWFVDKDLGDAAMGEGPSAYGRLRAVTVGPDGAIYIGTSNRDRGRGNVRDGDDRVIRIAPAE
jgi:glucose/arabinose dehydrogenase